MRQNTFLPSFWTAWVRFTTEAKIFFFYIASRLALGPNQPPIHCKEDFEICAIQLVPRTSNPIILSLYRTASGEVNEFLRRLDATLKYLYNPKSEFIICGDI
jgi:hypothetical protein